ncbi:Pimeloyl-ACP methyl ester carboxylesterase [Streptomyces zhaozhouensis]|uniref:Pimeloyl-ACP methyl ester carboxylesterase n=1 Tax=Streptomyces zhaozhouensis TaxID=1300267 RepID=A0A286DXX6_9ACTN|nr:alpha/beta hydrolase [Streptomyces zhaozhouensis]SOD63493.1 Pimeloyl-ACP methyl ester carboxylesterase [Streptomyces zhaozhouensis]
MAEDIRRLRVTSTGGARLHTEVSGQDDAPTVVLVHGWTCDTTFWLPVARQLRAAGHRVVAYDQRGHGHSRPTPGSCSVEALADDLCAVLEATLPEGRRAVLCGHSMGAMTVFAAADRPELRERAAAALLCSTGTDRLAGESTVLPLRPGGWRDRAHRAFLRTRLPYGPLTPLSRRIIRHITLGPGATPGQLEGVARMVNACPRRARAEWGAVLASLDLSAHVPRLDLPVAVLQGTADRLTPPVHAHRIHGRLSRPAGLTELPGIGHMTPVEVPDTVAEKLGELAKEYL